MVDNRNNYPNINIVVIAPHWRDASFYNKWKKSKYCKHNRVYYKKQLPVEHTKGFKVTLINNNFQMILFHLKN